VRTQAAVDEFLNSRLAQNVSGLTIDWYQAKLTRFARACPKLPDSPRPIEAFLASPSTSATTKLNYFNALRIFFRFTSERHRWRWRDPMAKMRPPSLPKTVMATLDADEEMRLLNSASTLRDRTILTLLVDSGLRSSELSQLRRQDIKAEALQVRGKTGERHVPISEETRTLLLLVAEGSQTDYIFHGHKGPLTRHGIYRVVSEHMRKAGILGPKLGPHRIRHAFGKGYLVNGGDTRSLQLIMGHARITTTEKYAALVLADLIDKHHKFTPLRAAHAAAQESLFDKAKVVEEAEEIVKRSGT